MNPKKIPLGLVDLRFVERMAYVLAQGLKNGRKPFDYKDREPTPDLILEYFSALLRHLKTAQNTTDGAEAIDALASVAANCQILAELFGLGYCALPDMDCDPDQEMAADYFDNDGAALHGWIDHGKDAYFHYHNGSKWSICERFGISPERIAGIRKEQPADRVCLSCVDIYNEQLPLYAGAPDPVSGWSDQGFEGFHYYENSNRALCNARLPCAPAVEPLHEKPADRICINCNLLYSDPERIEWNPPAGWVALKSNNTSDGWGRAHYYTGRRRTPLCNMVKIDYGQDHRSYMARPENYCTICFNKDDEKGSQ